MVDTTTQLNTTPTDNAKVGNTSPAVNLRARHWIITWNNYTETDYETLRNWCNEYCKQAVMQRELGENETPHIQGFISFKNARTFNSLKNKWPEMHIEKCNNIEASKKYCQKSETKIGQTDYINTRPPVRDPLEGLDLRAWQALATDIIKNKTPDDRTIYWFYDSEGNTGKTTLAKHLCLEYPLSILYVTGKSADIKYGIAKFLENDCHHLKAVIFDYTRSNENYISYQAIEEVKNGIFFNNKYESKMIIFDCPHVICLANFPPDLSKLSIDRWQVYNIETLELNDL